MRIRSPREIGFRLRQETANLYLWLRRPTPGVASTSIRPLLPNATAVAERQRGSSYAAEVEKEARGILENRIPLLGGELSFTGAIPWRRDWQTGREFQGTPYFRRVPYLDFERAGDHKFIWELNRHQYFVLLAQAGLLTGQPEFFETLIGHWEDWVRENPFQRGINWTSALEVAFRALSWTWVYHLAGDRMDESLRRRFLTELYRHGCHLENNLSVYFSPNTHLLGEAVALHALGALFEDFPRSDAWRETGSRIVREELRRQVKPDGSHFEQSTYYHIYALDFFLLHYLLAGRPREFDAPLIRMAEYLDAIQGPERRIPFIGDDDGGRLFHPYGQRDCFGRATLATCAVLFDRADWLHATADLHSQAAWWLGPDALDFTAAARPPQASRLFPDAGMTVFEHPSLFALADAGGFGGLRAGHSHSDTLSLIVRRAGHDLLIDPGTYSYADPQWRSWFRGSAAHNTIRVDRKDQAPSLGPFAWASKPDVIVRAWKSTAESDYLDAVCKYAGQPFAHRRRIHFQKDRGWFLIVDHISGTEDEHLVEQSWHSPSQFLPAGDHAFEFAESGGARLLLDPTLECSVIETCQSPAYGIKLSGWSIEARRKTRLPVMLATAIVDSSCFPPTVRVEQNGPDTTVTVGGIEVRFPE